MVPKEVHEDFGRSMKWIVLALCLLFHVSPMDGQRLAESEKNTLLSLYESTGGSSWANQTGWSSPNSDPCTWFGVTCNGIPSIASLHLNGNNLTGQLPPSLVNLTAMTLLDLRFNALQGQIPTFSNTSQLSQLILWGNNFTDGLSNLCVLSQVQIITLRSNSFSGSIPDCLCGLTSLLSLDISTNFLTGNLPLCLGALSGLIKLDLSTNMLMGEIPSSFSGLTNVETLNLGSNTFVGSVPVALTSLTSLSTLSLSSNSLTGTLPSFENSTSLEYFVVASNSLSFVLGQAPPAVGTCDLSGNLNFYCGEIPEWVLSTCGGVCVDKTSPYILVGVIFVYSAIFLVILFFSDPIERFFARFGSSQVDFVRGLFGRRKSNKRRQ
ncbi:RHS repeat-associated core domain-containing protein [Planoprotostelium fungivorum]|uniref:RHS repeat-associated core domain-containing protein n=1 Tax=Planoprotostelium fungivorum TaxID=1890364 RepID=A0A2P6N506_9EUKA|nr:RHS repeat-associated core domain-containing protein [Planoprotostelium fungivorum]